MKTHILLFLGALLLGQYATADVPDLQKGVKIQADGEDIDIEVGHLVPWTMDWNGDGRKDLILGQFNEGRIQLYLNHGTDAAPLLRDSGLVEAGGRPSRLDAG